MKMGIFTMKQVCKITKQFKCCNWWRYRGKAFLGPEIKNKNSTKEGENIS